MKSMFDDINHFPSIADTYTFLKKLGKGSQGMVYLVKEISSGALRVIKSTSLTGIKVKNKGRSVNEALLLEGMDHKNIIKIYDWTKSSKGDKLLLVL